MVCRACENHHGHWECLNRRCWQGIWQILGLSQPSGTGHPEALAKHWCRHHPRLPGIPPSGQIPVAAITLQNLNNPCCMELCWLKGSGLAEKCSKLPVSCCQGCTAPCRCSSTSDRTTFWSNGALVRGCFFTSGRQRVTLSPCSLLMRSPI